MEDDSHLEIYFIEFYSEGTDDNMSLLVQWTSVTEAIA